MSNLNNIRGIRRDLRAEGFGREAIKMALQLMVRISALDRRIFPENSATFCFARKRHKFGYIAGFVRPIKYNHERTYTIFMPDLEANLRREKKAKRVLLKKESRGYRAKLISYTWEELLISIASHEVRHRVQSEHSLKRFSPRSIGSFDDPLLRAIISFTKTEFEERRKIYLRDGKSGRFISDRLSRKEFDASVIERLVLHMVHRKNVYTLLEQILLAIKTQAS